MRGANRIGALLLGLLLLLACNTAAAQQREALQLARTEAIYLLNFIRYTTWPDHRFEARQAPYVVYIAAPHWYVRLVRSVARQLGQVGDRPLLIRRLRLPRDEQIDTEALQQRLRPAHAVFVHRSMAPLQQAVLEAVDGRPVLTVGNGDDFLDVGGMLRLSRIGERMTFYADPQRARAADLLISTKVLKMARNRIGPN